MGLFDGIFSRKRFAEQLGVTPARISQMQSAQKILPPSEAGDGEDSGWAATYVMEMSAQRTGRLTSKSLFGIPPQEQQAQRIGDVLVDDVFVQLFQNGQTPIAFAAVLKREGEAIGQFAPRIHERSDRRDAEIDRIFTSAAESLGVDKFAVAWVWYQQPDYYGVPSMREVVVIEDDDKPKYEFGQRRFEPQRRTELAFAPVELSTLRQKLGRPVPMIPPTFACTRAVELWRREGRDKTVHVITDNWGYNEALAAALVAGLAESDSTAGGEAASVACSRLVERIHWDKSGVVDEDPWSYPPGASEHVEWLALEQQRSFDHLRPTQERYADVDPNATPEQRQAAADWLGQQLYDHFGTYGDKPDVGMAYALKIAIGAVTGWRPGDNEEFSTTVLEPRFHDLREFTLTPGYRETWSEYARGLRPIDRAETPAARHLLSLLTDAERAAMQDPTVRSPRLMVDADDNPVLVREVTSWDEEERTQLTAAAPIVRFGKVNAAIRGFDEIIVEADTQEGPILVRVDGQLHLAPFAIRQPSGFTHGYNGSGPGNLISALGPFLEWAFGAPLTEDGRELLRIRVITADQVRPLRITRDEFSQPGILSGPRPAEPLRFPRW